MKVAIFSICLLLNVSSFSKNWCVSIQNGQSNLKETIQLANNFDTIFIQKGIYKEGNIIIGKPLSLIGIDSPILDGQNKCEILTIKSSHVNICGLKIQNSAISSIEEYAGIKVLNANLVRIERNEFLDCFFGIYLYQCQNIRMEANSIRSHQSEEQQSGNGIHCWKSDSLQIIANKIEGHRDGIYFEFVTASIIWRNLSLSNLRYGLHFMFSHNDTYVGNVFKSNGAGVSVMYTKGVRMYNNHFELNWGDASHGILIKDISDSDIIGNRFSQNTNAIYMEGSSRLHVEKNEFLNNGWAFKIQASCMDINVIHNNFLGNSFDIGTNGNLMLNHFSENYWDKYEGYDLNKDKIGDIPYRPVSLYSMIVEINPPAMVLFRSMIVFLLDKSEKVIPTITPENLIDNKPLMRQLPL